MIFPLAKVSEVEYILCFCPRGGGQIQAAVSEIQADFQNCHIWAWSLAIGQSSRSCMCIYSFYPQGGRNWALIYCHSTTNSFRDMGRFSKWPDFQTFQKLHRCTYTLFLPQVVKIELIFTLRAAVSDTQTNFKIAIFGHETCPIGLKVPEVEHILCLCPREGGCSKLSLFLLDRQRFPRYGIFKIAIFGHETWPLAKVPEVAHTDSFYPRGVEIELIFALRTVVSEIRANFQIAIFGHETWPLAKVPSCTYCAFWHSCGSFVYCLAELCAGLLLGLPCLVHLYMKWPRSGGCLSWCVKRDFCLVNVHPCLTSPCGLGHVSCHPRSRTPLFTLMHDGGLYCKSFLRQWVKATVSQWSVYLFSLSLPSPPLMKALRPLQGWLQRLYQVRP